MDNRPPYLSVSQVTGWLLCGRKYKFRYIEKREPEKRSADLALGSVVHSAIEWWENERILGRSPCADDAVRLFKVDWHSQTATAEYDFEDKSAEDLKILGESLVRLYVDRFASEPPPAAAELRFEVPLVDPRNGATLPVPLVGFFDQVGNGFVGELKTAAKKTPISTYGLQLAAYSYARKLLTGQRPIMRVVELVKTKVPKIEVEEVTLTDHDEDWFVEIACEVYDAIERGAFPPNPSWMCGRCEYAAACKRAA